ncbi:unnamed protein product [Citrullus colocynthis]|uniref:Uncharacterized protein n=1 Tax=Citrullus colocynthis TaxID=252529 RepID=A0ABP0Y0U1_9ROSI
MDDYSGRALILKDDAVPRWVDHRGHPSRRSESGRWRAAGMIIGVEIAERLAFFGISTNLVSYLTVEMGQSMAAAAENVNLWVGTASLLLLLAASFADSFLGRYLTILLASALYILGLGLLTLSAVLASPSSFQGGSGRPVFDVVLFFSALYLVAFAQARNWRMTSSSDIVILEEGRDAMLYQRCGQLRGVVMHAVVLDRWEAANYVIWVSSS